MLENQSVDRVLALLFDLGHEKFVFRQLRYTFAEYEAFLDKIEDDERPIIKIKHNGEFYSQPLTPIYDQNLAQIQNLLNKKRDLIKKFQDLDTENAKTQAKLVHASNRRNRNQLNQPIRDLYDLLPIPDEQTINYLEHLIRDLPVYYAQLLKEIPSNEKLALFNEEPITNYVKSVLAHGSELHRFLSSMTSADCWALISSPTFAPTIESLLLNETIHSGSQHYIDTVLQFLPADKRWAFLQRKTSKGTYLDRVLEIITQLEFKEFEQQGYRASAHRIPDLYLWASGVHTNDKLAFATHPKIIDRLIAGIDNGRSLVCYIDNLPENDRIKFLLNPVILEKLVSFVLNNPVWLGILKDKLPNADKNTFAQNWAITDLQRIIQKDYPDNPLLSERIVRIQNVRRANNDFYVYEDMADKEDFYHTRVHNEYDLARLRYATPLEYDGYFWKTKFAQAILPRIVTNRTKLVNLLALDSDNKKILSTPAMEKHVPTLLNNDEDLLAVLRCMNWDSSRFEFLTSVDILPKLPQLITKPQTVGEILKLLFARDGCTDYQYEIKFLDILQNNLDLSTIYKTLDELLMVPKRVKNIYTHFSTRLNADNAPRKTLLKHVLENEPITDKTDLIKFLQQTKDVVLRRKMLVESDKLMALYVNAVKEKQEKPILALLGDTWNFDNQDLKAFLKASLQGYSERPQASYEFSWFNRLGNAKRQLAKEFVNADNMNNPQAYQKLEQEHETLVTPSNNNWFFSNRWKIRMGNYSGVDYWYHRWDESLDSEFGQILQKFRPR